MPRIIELGAPRQLASEGEAEQDEPRIIELGGLQEEPSLAEQALGVLETGLSVGSTIIAEPAAGIAGGVTTLLAGPEAGEAVISGTREALTFEPVTEAGKETAKSLGKVLEPLGEVISGAQEFLGDSVFEVTGSPALASAAATMPAAILEIIGFKGTQALQRLGKASARTTKAAKNINRARKKLQAKAAKKIPTEIVEAAPTIQQLKKVSGGLYKEVDNFGVKVKPEAFDSFATNAQKFAIEKGLDPVLTPGATQLLKRLDEVKGQTLTTTQIDTLRKVAQNTAGSAEAADRLIGSRVVSMMDDLLEDSRGLIVPEGVNPADISLRLKAARKLWGQARRGEIIEEAFARAQHTASGFENGLRQEFRALLKTKRTRQLFSAEEQALMRRVSQGDIKTNLAKTLGKFGISFDQPGIIGASAGVGVGTVSGIPGGGLILPFVGTVSKQFAKKLMEKNAVFADAVIRSGRDATKISKAYLKNVKGKARNPDNLASLLMKTTPEELARLPKTPFLDQAKRIVISRKRAAAEAGGAGLAAFAESQAQREQ